MSSITLSNSVQRAETHRIAWTRLWRIDTAGNLLFSDLLLFAAVPLQKALDMSPDAVTPTRILGAVLVVYSLIQLWFSRQGEPSPWVYRLAAMDMALCGAFLAIVAAAVEMNMAGVVGSVALSAGSWLLAGLYYTRSRQLEE